MYTNVKTWNFFATFLYARNKYTMIRLKFVPDWCHLSACEVWHYIVGLFRYLRSEYEHDSREKDAIIDTLMHENCYMKNLLEFEIDLDASLNKRVLESLESDIYQLDQNSDRVSEILRFNKYNKEIFEQIGHIINDEEKVDIIAEKISAKRINLDLRDKAMNISNIVSSMCLTNIYWLLSYLT